jgi:hypothetical protein
VGEGVKMLKLREEAREELRKDLAEHDLKAFPLVVVAPNLQVGIHTLVQAFGIGPLKVNTILLNWLEELPRGILGLGEQRYGRNLRVAFRLGSNIIILCAQANAWEALEAVPPEQRRIDVWWRDDATSRLMLLLAYLMKRNESWGEASIRLFALCHDQEHEQTAEAIQRILEEARIDAETEIIGKADADVIAGHSSDASLVFLPFRLRVNEVLDWFGGPLGDMISRLSVVAAVLAAEDIELDAEPEEGKAAEIAAAFDALLDAQEQAKRTEKEAAETASKADEMLHKMREAVLSGDDEETLEKSEIAAKEAKEQAIKAARRAAKALAKAEDAARVAEALGVKPSEENEKSEKSSSLKKNK